MPHTVRTHTRKTASGRTVTVRQHSRKGGSTRAATRSPRKRATILLASTSAILAAAIATGNAGAIAAGAIAALGALVYFATSGKPRPGRRTRHAEDWWAADLPAPATPAPQPAARRGDREFAVMQAQMRQWRSRPEPAPAQAEPMNPQLARALGCDTPEGLAVYERGRAYREAGYTGPLDSANRIPDPDDPANYEMLHTLAALREASA